MHSNQCDKLEKSILKNNTAVIIISSFITTNIKCVQFI